MLSVKFIRRFHSLSNEFDDDDALFFAIKYNLIQKATDWRSRDFSQLFFSAASRNNSRDFALYAD